MKIPFIAAAAGLLLTTLMLNGCARSPAVQPVASANLCEPDAALESSSCHWTRSVQHQLNQQFRDAARYAGQQCWLRLEWQASGRFAVTQTQGDEALCLRAWQLVARSGALPPPPDRTQPAWFGFAPHTS
ncbi:cell envelope integrity TolA C-terminal domain-containing protein [Pantoea eucrina]|uniref:cell envelope integrity TolA C-terminal domain-containing protein n=1 Tax=Pantoea eucrina TaxID=472693 RepID=UPI00080F3BA9|nr:cell envelope integrity TolA C-terminal domain-containing protein [Pantoea eucrina]